MLAIRLQRTGRRGHAQFRVIVQDARLTPTSGNVVALLGNYDPHAKKLNLTKEKAEFYLKNGAQPSPRVVRLLQAEGITLPSWVKVATTKERTIRNPEKLRRNRPAEAAPTETSVKAEPVAESTESTEATPTAEPEAAAASDKAEPVASESSTEPANAAPDAETPEAEAEVSEAAAENAEPVEEPAKEPETTPTATEEADSDEPAAK